MSELMSILIWLASRPAGPARPALPAPPGPCALPALPALLRRRLLLFFLRRLRRPRPIDAQARAVPERLDLPLDLVVAADEIFEVRLVPLEPRGRDELHPVA